MVEILFQNAKNKSGFFSLDFKQYIIDAKSSKTYGGIDLIDFETYAKYWYDKQKAALGTDANTLNFPSTFDEMFNPSKGNTFNPKSVDILVYNTLCEKVPDGWLKNNGDSLVNSQDFQKLSFLGRDKYSSNTAEIQDIGSNTKYTSISEKEVLDNKSDVSLQALLYPEIKQSIATTYDIALQWKSELHLLNQDYQKWQSWYYTWFPNAPYPNSPIILPSQDSAIIVKDHADDDRLTWRPPQVFNINNNQPSINNFTNDPRGSLGNWWYYAFVSRQAVYDKILNDTKNIMINSSLVPTLSKPYDYLIKKIQANPKFKSLYVEENPKDNTWLPYKTLQDPTSQIGSFFPGIYGESYFLITKIKKP
jgi:hypothetical protein